MGQMNIRDVKWGTHVFRAVVTLLAASLIWAFLADRSPPFTFTSLSVQEPRVQAGGTALIAYQANIEQVCPLEIEVSVIDSQTTQFDVMPLKYPRGLPGPAGRIPVPIPAAAAEGPTIVQITASNQCNYLQKKWPVKYPSDDVTITVFQSGAPPARSMPLPSSPFYDGSVDRYVPR